MQTLAFSDLLLEKKDEGLKQCDAFCHIVENLPPLSREGPWMVGGTVRRLMVDEEFTSDVDIMFKNMKQFDDFCSQMRERGADTVDESPRQITFKYKSWEIQPIRAVFHDTLPQTLQDFDFTICQFGFDGMCFVWGDESLNHLKEKQLVFTHTTDHVSTMRRAFKYADQGFFMDHESIGKFLKDAIKQAAKVDEADAKWEAEAKASEGFPLGRRGLRPASSYGV
jgi:hypothetical protein